MQAHLADLAQRLRQGVCAVLLVLQRATRLALSAHGTGHHGAATGRLTVLHGKRLKRQITRLHELMERNGRRCMLILGHVDDGVLVARREDTRHSLVAAKPQRHAVMIVTRSLLHLGTRLSDHMRYCALGETLVEVRMTGWSD